MEIIQAYVENTFRNYPETPDVLHTKESTLKNMTAKYQELKSQGCSENEAVGKAISEFGDVNKLMQSLSPSPIQPNSKSSLSLEEVQSYLEVKKKTGRIISVGVVLCILSATTVCLFNGLAESNILRVLLDSDGDTMLSYLSLFLLVACAVGLFLYAGSLTKEYEFIEKGVTLDSSIRQYLITMQKQKRAKHTAMQIAGVVICILSPISFFVMEQFLKKDNSLCCVPFLLLIAIAVFLFVLSGCENAPYETLLKEAQKTPAQRKTDRLYGMINSVILLCATAVYLLLGFCYGQWDSAPVIYSLAGILCGISSTIIWAVRKDTV